MRKAWIITCTLLFVSVVGFAQTPSPTPLSPAALAAILGQPAGTGACPLPRSKVLFAAKKPNIGLEKSLCSATATCDTGTVTCNGNSSTTSCTAVDRNCAINEPGHVTCDGVTTSCPNACPSCTNSCCRCDQTGDCFYCCRCGGGTISQCSQECSE